MSTEEKQLQRRQTVTELVAAQRNHGGMAIINSILGHPDAVGLIQSLEPEEMFALFAELGKGDCGDLVRYATTEQFQGLVDLETWAGDRFVPERLESLVSLATGAGQETLERFIDSLDDEAAVLYLRQRAQVVARTMDPDQDDEMSVPELEAFHTPDNMFWIAVPAESPYFNDIRFLVERLYDRDHLDTSALLRHAIYEDLDVLEKEADGFRRGRVAAMGFPSVEDAEELLVYMNPRGFKERMDAKLERLKPYDVGELSLLPALLGAGQRPPRFLNDVIAAIEDSAVQGRVAQAVAYLANAIIVLRNTGDLTQSEGRNAGLKSALSVLSVGLEYLSEGKEERAQLVISRVWPRTIFRVGFSLLLALRSEAEKALQYAGRPEGFFLYDPPLNELIAGLFEEIPLYHTALENKPDPRLRDFRTAHDVARTKAALLQAMAVGQFVEQTLKLDVTQLAQRVPAKRRSVTTHTTLMATALINALLGNDDDPTQAIDRNDLSRIVDLVFVPGGDGIDRIINPRLTAAVEVFVKQSKNRFAAALLELSLRKLEDLFRRFPKGHIPDAKYAAPILLVK